MAHAIFAVFVSRRNGTGRSVAVPIYGDYTIKGNRIYYQWETLRLNRGEIVSEQYFKS